MQWLLVSVVMCVDRCNTADFTDMSFQLSSFQRSLHRQMGIIFFRVCSTPIRLPCVTFNHYIGFLSLEVATKLKYNIKPIRRICYPETFSNYVIWQKLNGSISRRNLSELFILPVRSTC